MTHVGWGTEAAEDGGASSTRRQLLEMKYFGTGEADFSEPSAAV
jgi:hypothetical protein